MGISLKELKKNRLTPAEKWVLERIRGCVSKPRTNRDNTIEWWKDGNWLFEQDFTNGWLWLSWSCIRRILFEEFELNDNEIEELLTNLLYDYTDNGRLKILI